MDRATLYARADARVDAMMAAGLPDEVARLLDRGYDWQLPSMSGLGYIQFRPHFDGRDHPRRGRRAHQAGHARLHPSPVCLVPPASGGHPLAGCGEKPIKPAESLAKYFLHYE